MDYRNKLTLYWFNYCAIDLSCYLYTISVSDEPLTALVQTRPIEKLVNVSAS